VCRSCSLNRRPRICYHFVDKYHYASSNDVEFVGQALW
jgi:hypothetical protein